MTNQLQIITERNILGKDFRVYDQPENPLFLAKDVAEWIEHSDVSMMLKSIDDDEKLTQTLFVSGQNRECWFLTEDGLYEVLFQSRKPLAKQFKREVKKVLREIRLGRFERTIGGSGNTTVYRIADKTVEVPTNIDCTVSISKTGAITVKHFAPKPMKEPTKRLPGRPRKEKGPIFPLLDVAAVPDMLKPFFAEECLR